MQVNPEWKRQRAAQKKAQKALDAERDRLLAAIAENDADMVQTDVEWDLGNRELLARLEALEDVPEVSVPKYLDPAPVAAGGEVRVVHAETPRGEARRRGWGVWRKGA